MSKSQVIDKIMEATRQEVEAFMAIEDQIETGLEYENKVIEICRSLGQKLVSGGRDVEKRGKNSKKSS